MRHSFYTCDNCGEAFSDYCEGYEWCESCGSIICPQCSEDFYCDFIQDPEEGYVIECPLCDQFRHMTENYRY